MVDDLIDKVLEYLLWLQEPHDSFGGMPVCPFVKKDFESNDIEYIMYSPDMEFIEAIDQYVESGKRTGLIIQIGINKPYKVRNGRKKYQTYLNKVIAEKYPKSEDQPKVLVFDPNEEWTAGGGIETRKMAPTVLISRNHFRSNILFSEIEFCSEVSSTEFPDNGSSHCLVGLIRRLGIDNCCPAIHRSHFLSME